MLYYQLLRAYDNFQSNYLLRKSKNKTLTTKNISHKKGCNTSSVKIHVDPPLTLLMKINIDTKAQKYCVEIKLRRYPTSENSDFYEFKVTLFDNGESEEFLLFV